VQNAFLPPPPTRQGVLWKQPALSNAATISENNAYKKDLPQKQATFLSSISVSEKFTNNKRWPINDLVFR
jgi:hypothetical protein